MLTLDEEKILGYSPYWLSSLSACYDSPFAHNTTINQPIPTSPTEKKPNWQPPPAETYYKPDEYILKTITHTICIPTVVTSVISEKIPYPTTTSTSVKPIMPTASAPSQTEWVISTSIPVQISKLIFHWSKYKQLYPNFTGAASRIRYSGILIGVACAIVFLLWGFKDFVSSLK